VGDDAATVRWSFGTLQQSSSISMRFDEPSDGPVCLANIVIFQMLLPLVSHSSI